LTLKQGHCNLPSFSSLYSLLTPVVLSSEIQSGFWSVCRRRVEILEKGAVDGSALLVLVLAQLAGWLSQSLTQRKGLLSGKALDAEDGGITSVIDNLVGSLRSPRSGQVPVFLESLPGGSILGSGSGSVVLGGEDVA
jgi:hypothetical protein